MESVDDNIMMIDCQTKNKRAGFFQNLYCYFNACFGLDHSGHKKHQAVQRHCQDQIPMESAAVDVRVDNMVATIDRDVTVVSGPDVKTNIVVTP